MEIKQAQPLKKASPDVEYHADDYGLFPAQSSRILNCAENGVLNAVSVMPNSPFLPECMDTLRPYRARLKIAVHLNFMEGQALCPGFLTGTDGTFRFFFGSLLLRSFLPGRKKYRAAFREEIRAQLHAVLPYLEEGASLRVDGHAHYHMIPVLFDALMDVVREDKIPLSYIRIPQEPLRLYLRHWRQLNGFQPINLVKVVILNALAWRNLHKYRSCLSRLEQRVFLGVMFSGHMNFSNVSALLNDAKTLAAQKGRGVEILAHPGGVYEPADLAQLTNRDDAAFLSSPLRQAEGEMFCLLNPDTG